MAFGMRAKASVVSRVGGAVLLCLVAGCTGAGSGTSSAAGRAGGCDSPGVTANSIKVGLIYPDTGGMGPTFATARGGFEARIDLANAQGGINGRQVQVVWGDDQGDPSINLVTARDLVQGSGVFALSELTTAASGSAAYLSSAGVPVAGLAVEPVWSQYDNMFSTSYEVAEEGSVSTYGRFVAAKGGTKAVVVEASNSPASRATTNGIIQSLTGAGVQVVARLSYTVGVTSLTQLASAIAASKADVLVGQLGGTNLVDVLGATRQAGLTFKIVVSDTVYDSALLARDGAKLAGVTTYIAYLPFESTAPALTTFRDAIRRFSPEIDNPDQSVVVGAYGEADLLLRGLEVAGACPTRAGFITNLRNVHDFTAAGIIPAGVDLSTNRGLPSVCQTFLTVNAQGTAFQIDKAPNGDEEWCGTRIGA